jgi:hypothetical protein
MPLDECVVEEAVLSWFKQRDYIIATAQHFRPGDIAVAPYGKGSS